MKNLKSYLLAGALLLLGILDHATPLIQEIITEMGLPPFWYKLIQLAGLVAFAFVTLQTKPIKATSLGLKSKSRTGG